MLKNKSQVERLVEDIEAEWGVGVTQLLELYLSNASREVMAETLNVPVWTIRSVMALLNLRSPKKFRANDLARFYERYEAEASPIAKELAEANSSLNFLSESLVSKDKTIVGLRAKLAALQKGLKQEARLESLQEVVDRAIKAVAKDVRLPKLPKKASVSCIDGTMMLVLSDLHFDEVVSAEEVPHNEFNWEIAESRLERYFEAAVSKHQGERRLVITCLSDFLTGIIHNAQENASKPIIQAVDALALTLSNHIASISTMFEVVEVYTVEANHERLSDKPASFSKSFDFSYVLYKLLEARLDSYRNISFYISTTGYNVIPIGDKVIGIHHGDRVREAISPARTLKVKEIFRQTLGQTVDCIIQGHLHAFSTAYHGDTLHIVSPSMIGAGNYSQSSGFLSTPPAQLILHWDAEGSLESLRVINLS